MKVVLIALLYATPLSEPSVFAIEQTYSDMQSCLQDAIDVETWLMSMAPNEDSYVDVQCITVPREV
jgi:hypothetical protein